MADEVFFVAIRRPEVFLLATSRNFKVLIFLSYSRGYWQQTMLITRHCNC